jgi:death-on-curing protein
MSRGELRRVREDVVRAIHRRQLAEHGGSGGIRDEGLLLSALHRPIDAGRYADPPPDLATLAAAYAFGIARNHPFVDGNKRVAYVVCRLFLILNGWDFEAERSEAFETFLALAAGRTSEAELADWLRSRLRRRGRR